MPTRPWNGLLTATRQASSNRRHELVEWIGGSSLRKRANGLQTDHPSEDIRVLHEEARKPRRGRHLGTNRHLLSASVTGRFAPPVKRANQAAPQPAEPATRHSSPRQG